MWGRRLPQRQLNHSQACLDGSRLNRERVSLTLPRVAHRRRAVFGRRGDSAAVSLDRTSRGKVSAAFSSFFVRSLSVRVAHHWIIDGEESAETAEQHGRGDQETDTMS
jgi:hypothetical protein